MASSALSLAPNRIKASTITLPGSKSISNRSLLLAALADNSCYLHNVLASDDTERMQDALGQLGIELTSSANNEIFIRGCRGQFPNNKTDLFLGNAGTAFRPLTAVLALQNGYYYLHGTPRMHERPILDLVKALQSLGADIDYGDNIGYPPLKIHPFKDNTSPVVKISGQVSSQYLTALLLALPLLQRSINIEIIGTLISQPYIDITLNMMKKFGIEVTHDNYKNFTIPASNGYHAPEQYYIESDASSASYFLAASFLCNTPITLNGIGKNSIQGDLEFAYELEKLGAKLEYEEQFISLVENSNQFIPAFDIDALRIPDAAMTLCIIALAANGTSTIRNIESWKVKETDRILAMKTELEKLGATVLTTNNSIQITPPKRLNNEVAINTYDDHRMALCFSLVCLLDTTVIINDPACVNKTFPNYFEVFKSILLH